MGQYSAANILAFQRAFLKLNYTADHQDLQWRLRESTWLAVCSRDALQI